jgi:hypothetical protein
MASFRVPQDFTSFDDARDLQITVGFDPPLIFQDTMKVSHDVVALSLRCQPYKRSGPNRQAGDLHVDLTPIGKKGEPPTVATGFSKDRKPEFKPLLSPGTALRDQGRILFIDHRRSLAQHLPTVRGSALARLFEPVRRAFNASANGDTGRAAFQVQYQAALETLRTAELQTVEQVISDTTKRMVGFLGGQVLQDVTIGFGFADPSNPFNSLRLEFREGGLTVPGEELGLGVQSAMVVGVFEALRQLGDPIGTVVIEEPEMYLHPQAQRYFYRLLTDMVDDGSCQVIYSTHSPHFADMTRFEGIRLVRRPPGGSTSATFVEQPSDLEYLAGRRDAQRLVTSFTASRSEALFADRVLLVEGVVDVLAVRLLAQTMGYDLDAENAAVVDCGGKTAIPFYARICRALEINYVVLHDDDIADESAGAPEDRVRIASNNAKHRRSNEEIASVTPVDRLFIIAPSLEGALGLGRDADKPRRVAEEMAARRLDQLPPSLIAAVQSLVPNPPSS